MAGDLAFSIITALETFRIEVLKTSDIEIRRQFPSFPPAPPPPTSVFPLPPAHILRWVDVAAAAASDNVIGGNIPIRVRWSIKWKHQGNTTRLGWKEKPRERAGLQTGRLNTFVAMDLLQRCKVHNKPFANSTQCRWCWSGRWGWAGKCRKMLQQRWRRRRQQQRGRTFNHYMSRDREQNSTITDVHTQCRLSRSRAQKWLFHLDCCSYFIKDYQELRVLGKVDVCTT